MKLTALWVILIILAALAIGLFVASTIPGQRAPRFDTVQPPTSVTTMLTYDFGSPRPFESSRMWINADDRALIYDVEQRQVLGQMSYGWPAMLFGSPAQVLCYQAHTFRSSNRWTDRVLSLVARFSGGRIKLPYPVAGDTCWLVDLNENAARPLGDIPGLPFPLFPSPDCHYAFTARAWASRLEVYLLDLRKGSMRKVQDPFWQWAIDWWDSTRILVGATNCDLVLYDVRKRRTSPLITLAKIAAFLQKEGIADDPKLTRAFAVWNGHDNDFYLTDTHQKWLAEESFLIKVERPDAKLKLLSARFKFEWSDHFDPTGQYYLFSGREPGLSSDGVFLRDLRDGATRVLVAPTTNNYFSCPRFYRDSVVYVRSNALWQINLDGSNNTRLFPSSGGMERRQE